jgi:peptidyl-prolyl cis-trans isomerase D
VWFTTKLQVKTIRCQDLELLQTLDFVNSNSDVPYDSTYIAKKDLPAVDADKLFLQVLFTGRIFGKYYCISKSLGMKSGVNAKASHILIGYEGSQVPNQKKKNERGSES